MESWAVFAGLGGHLGALVTPRGGLVGAEWNPRSDLWADKRACNVHLFH